MNFPFGVANGVEIRTNENNMRNIDAPNLFSSSHMAVSETRQTLKLFPEEASFPLVAREKDSSNNAYGFQKQTCCASNFMLAVNEIDLELHLGYKIYRRLLTTLIFWMITCLLDYNYSFVALLCFYVLRLI